MAKLERFHSDFVLDLVSITEYYDSISASTGNRFRENIDERLDLILDSPEAFAVMYEAVRAVRMRNFP